jgi:RES domain-containing protein
MLVYRIAKRKYINDLSGEGARLYGGRWNKRGTGILYTSENRSLATVEYLVHLPMTLIPRDLCIAGIEVPAAFSCHTIEGKDLPDNWATYPAPLRLSEIIENILRDGTILCVKIPSAVVEGEHNILINPRHSDFHEVRIQEIRDFHIDERLLKI